MPENFRQISSQFIRFLAVERGLSPSYQSSVRQSLRHFQKWLEDKKFTLREFGTEELTSFLHQIKYDRKLSAASLRLLTIHLKIFFLWAQNSGATEINPAESLTTGKLSPRLPDTLSANSMRDWLDKVPTRTGIEKRDRAILEFFYSSGLRLSELCQAELSRLDLDEGFIRITGKGKKTRIARIGETARLYTQNYLEIRHTFINNKTSSKVFLSVRGSQLSPERVRQIVKGRALDAGITENVYPHLMRHSFATHLLDGGADLRVIQELLGHADISTTQNYTHVSAKGLKDAIKRFHPRG